MTNISRDSGNSIQLLSILTAPQRSTIIKKDLIRRNRDILEKMQYRIEKIREDYMLSEEETREMLSEILAPKEPTIPLSILSQPGQLSPLEAVVSYMRDKGMKFSEIAGLLNRDIKTVWATHSKAKGKRRYKTFARENDIYIPVRILADRRTSIVESICLYLKEKGLRNREIAHLLGRSGQQVWIAIRRGKRKLQAKRKNPVKTRLQKTRA